MQFDLNLEKHSTMPDRVAGVYFLIDDDNEVVYIGKSVDIFTRIRQHETSGKEFSYYAYIELNPEACQLKEIEADLIAIYSPKYNKAISYSSRYVELTGKFDERGFTVFTQVGNRHYVDTFSRVTGEAIIKNLKTDNQ